MRCRRSRDNGKGTKRPDRGRAAIGRDDSPLCRRAIAAAAGSGYRTRHVAHLGPPATPHRAPADRALRRARRRRDAAAARRQRAARGGHPLRLDRRQRAPALARGAAVHPGGGLAGGAAAARPRTLAPEPRAPRRRHRRLCRGPPGRGRAAARRRRPPGDARRGARVLGDLPQALRLPLRARRAGVLGHGPRGRRRSGSRRQPGWRRRCPRRGCRRSGTRSIPTSSSTPSTR